MSCLCVFKPKGYNGVNASRSERTGVAEWFQLLWRADPTPLPSPPPLSPSPLPLPSPPPSPRPSQIVSFGRDTHTPIPNPPTRRAGEGHWGRQPNRSSCLDALASSPTLGQPLSPCYLFIPSLGFQFRWQLTVASVVFKSIESSSPDDPRSKRNKTEASLLQSTPGPRGNKKQKASLLQTTPGPGGNNLLLY